MVVWLGFFFVSFTRNEKRKRKKKKRERGRQASNSESATMLVYFKSCLPVISQAGRQGRRLLGQPTASCPLAAVCMCLCVCALIVLSSHHLLACAAQPLSVPQKPVINRLALLFISTHVAHLEHRHAPAFFSSFYLPLYLHVFSLGSLFCWVLGFIIFFLTSLATAMATVTCLAKSFQRRKGAQSAGLAGVQCNHAAAPK